MSQEDLLLFDANDLKYTYGDTKDNLGGTTFRKYQVVNGKWILYRNTEFNDAQAGGNGSDILIADKPTGKNSLSFSPSSIRRLQDSSDSTMVFEHVYYGGKAEEYTDASPDVNQAFKSSTGAGASSIIIWPNKSWQLFNQTYYKGGEKTVKAGRYATPAQMGFPNDALQSLRPS